MGKSGDDQAIDTALEKVVKSDNYALVREAALRAAQVRGGDVARRTREWAESHDDEPRLKKLASQLPAQP
jgi:hypothetical protein